MNKDEAEKCTRIAKDHYAKGDYESALKFFRKSHRLHEDPVILDLIHRCEIAKSQGSSGPSASNAQTSQPKATRTETPGSSSASAPKSDPVKSQEIRKLLAIKDFYEILGVTKTSSDDEIKKAYRKLALKFHPDKNKEPGADEAFKKLAQAYDCLMNPDKRRKYDEYGNEEPEQHYRHYRQHYSEDISAEDIFGMFFGNAFFDDQPRRRYVYRQQRHPQHEAQRRAHQHHQQQGGNQNMKLLPLLQFLPLLIIIISSFALNFSQEEIPYSFMRTVKHPIQRSTRNLKLDYFVDGNFNVNYGQKPSKLVQIEENIEREHLSRLISRCQIMTQKKNMIDRKAYYSYGSSKENLEKEAKNIDLSACKDVQEIRQRFPHLFYY